VVTVSATHAPASKVRPAPAAGAVRRRLGAIPWAVAAGMALAAALGLAVPDLYRAEDDVAAMMRGYDAVTLALAVPVLVATLLGRWRRSAPAVLLRVGLMVYAVYSYALALLALPLTAVFLLHAAIVSAAVAGLAQTLVVEAREVRGVAPWFPGRTVAVVLLALGLGLGGMWAAEAVQAGPDHVPAGSALAEPATVVQLGMALDLVLLVPAYGLAAVLLWRRAPWAAAAAAAVLVSGSLHQVSYLAALWAQLADDVTGATWDTVEPVIAALFLVPTALLLLAVRPTGRAPWSTR